MATAGDYTGEQTWVSGAAPGISAAELNRVEDGIVEALERDVRHVTLSYNANGDLTTITERDAPAGTTVATTTLTYNANGDLTQTDLTVNGKTITTTLTYDADGNLSTTNRTVA